MTIGIYRIHNKVNDKNYIGSSAMNAMYRWHNHKHLLRHQKHTNPHLQAAWDKDGENNFEFFIVEECDKDIILNREDYWINYYDSRNPQKGYNLKTAEHHFHSEETKKKIGRGNKGKTVSDEAKKKISDTFKNKPDEFKHKMAEQMSERFSGKELSEEHKMKISQSEKGKIVSEETKRRMTIAKLNMSEETKKKIGLASKGRRHSEETKRKMSKSRKGKYCGENHPMWGKSQSKESRDKIGKAHTGLKHSEETKRKMRESRARINNNI